MKLTENQNLKDYNTFGMEVLARHFLQIENADEVPSLIRKYLHEKPFYILGSGSNTLFTKDFDGIVIHPVFTGIEVVEHHETEGIGTLAVDQMPGRILEAQSLDVDIVSGATVTSKAILEAVTDALSQAGVAF